MGKNDFILPKIVGRVAISLVRMNGFEGYDACQGARCKKTKEQLEREETIKEVMGELRAIEQWIDQSLVVVVLEGGNDAEEYIVDRILGPNWIDSDKKPKLEAILRENLGVLAK